MPTVPGSTREHGECPGRGVGGGGEEGWKGKLRPGARDHTGFPTTEEGFIPCKRQEANRVGHGHGETMGWSDAEDGEEAECRETR